MAQICKVGERKDVFKRYLSNLLEPWLLILGSVDDPSLEIFWLFLIGNSYTGFVTSQNPEYRCHATVGSRELHEMECDEAINFRLRSEDLFSENQNLRSFALLITQILGYLALPVNHAGTFIRQRFRSLENHLNTYTEATKL